MSTVPECFGGYLSGNLAAESRCYSCSYSRSCYRAAKERLAMPNSLSIERDPAGLQPHAHGAKLDGEKVMAELTLDGFSRALLAVAEVSTYGAKKYSIGGWQHVEDGQTRYRRAGDRHRLARGHETVDPDSRLLHLAHEAWNRLAELELMLRQRPAEATSPAGRHTGAPDAAPEQAATEEICAAGKPAGDTYWRVRFFTQTSEHPQEVVCAAPSAFEAATKVRSSCGLISVEGVDRAE